MTLRYIYCCGLTAMLEVMALASQPTLTISSVTAQQRNPWSGMVDVVVTVQGTSNDVVDAEWNFSATNGATTETIPVKHITRNGFDTESGNFWTCKFVWNAKVDVGAVKIGDVVLTVKGEIPLGGVQLWENGPYWAECNVGATKPEEYGYYFWWGDKVGYKRNATNSGWISVEDASSYSFSNCPTYGMKVSQLQSAGYTDTAGNLVDAHDAATAHLGSPWRMPTNAEFAALVGSCTTTWTTRNGVYGRLVAGKGAYASNKIFLPAAGYGSYTTIYNDCGGYWSATTDSSIEAFAFGFSMGSCSSSGRNYRSEGRSIRPLRGFAEGGSTPTTATTHLSIDCTKFCQVLSAYAHQRYPWNGLVDVIVTLRGSAEEIAEYGCTFTATNSAEHTSLLVEHIHQVGLEEGSGTTWTRKFIWDAKVDVGYVKIDDVALTVEMKPICVQLWEGGPCWAECNVGANQPEEYGYYFWWGDVVGYKREGNYWNAVDGSRFRFSFDVRNCPTSARFISELQSAGYIDTIGNLISKYDAATAHLGSPWRMPTEAEFLALINNCTTTWTTRNGVTGRLVTGKGAYASKSIFLPAAGHGNDSRLDDLGSRGCYRSSSPHSDYYLEAWYLTFTSGYFSRSSSNRYYGQSVRPVRGFAK